MKRLGERCNVKGAGARQRTLQRLRESNADSTCVLLWQFVLAQGLLVGVAGSATFAPIIADTSLWFTRRRGIAVAIIGSGSYLAGTVWPPIIQHFIQSEGWRRTYLGIGTTVSARSACTRAARSAALPTPRSSAVV